MRRRADAAAELAEELEERDEAEDLSLPFVGTWSQSSAGDFVV